MEYSCKRLACRDGLQTSCNLVVRRRIKLQMLPLRSAVSCACSRKPDGLLGTSSALSVNTATLGWRPTYKGSPALAWIRKPVSFPQLAPASSQEIQGRSALSQASEACA